LGARGEQYSWYPFQNVPPPSRLTIGGWLAGGRHWHFAIAWFFIVNGFIYSGYFFSSGEWRRRLFLPGRDAANALRQFAYYVRIRKSPPAEDFYNGLQRLSYSSVLLLSVVMVLSGLAIYKPVQLHVLTMLFGGYDGARAIHLAGLCLFGIFLIIHLALVLSHPRALLAMVTGGKRGWGDKQTRISQRCRSAVAVGWLWKPASYPFFRRDGTLEWTGGGSDVFAAAARTRIAPNRHYARVGVSRIFHFRLHSGRPRKLDA
jgi:thiosulfate reductase cytochrome b subunit